MSRSRIVWIIMQIICFAKKKKKKIPLYLGEEESERTAPANKDWDVLRQKVISKFNVAYIKKHIILLGLCIESNPVLSSYRLWAV